MAVNGRTLLVFVLVGWGVLACNNADRSGQGATATTTAEASPTASPPEPTQMPPTPAPTVTPDSIPENPQEPEPEPTPLLPGDGVISGRVWHDVCAAEVDSAGAGVAASPGCIVMDGAFRANGFHEIFDPGLPGITVALVPEACAGTPVKETTSDEEGFFDFTGLPPGKYCVRINPARPENAGLLVSGTWTAGPESGNGLVVDLAAEEVRSDLEFGWDFASLPVLDVAGCTEKAAFVEDVTVPDYTMFKPGESFVKTWRVRNEGTCTWSMDYSMVFVWGDAFGADPSVPFSNIVVPGAMADFTLEMKAPAGGGTFSSNWQFRNANGQQFGIGIPATSFIWALINVSYINADGNPAPAPEPAPGSGGGSGSASGGAQCPLVFDAGVENQVLSLINAERASASLPPLAFHSGLAAAARAHSTDMAVNAFIDHTGSDGSLWYGRIASQGYPYDYATENIYVGNPAFGGTAVGAVAWWMNSQVHRDNILSKAVDEIGVGYVFCESSTYGGYFTVVFARR